MCGMFTLRLHAIADSKIQIGPLPTTLVHGLVPVLTPSEHILCDAMFEDRIATISRKQRRS